MTWQSTVLFIIAVLAAVCAAVAFVYKVGKRDGVREKAAEEADTTEMRASKVPVLEELLTGLSSKVAINHAETRSDIAGIKSDITGLKVGQADIMARKASYPRLRIPTGFEFDPVTGELKKP